MTKLGIKYQDLIELGFKRIPAQDIVFFEIYGYNYFILVFELNKNVQLSYNAEDEFIELLVCDENGTIYHKSKIKDLKTIKLITKN